MSEDSEDEIDFEEQVKLYNLEKEGKLDLLKKNGTEDKKSYKDKDGVEYEWDEKRKAWYPKISEDFIAMYQASYGVAQTQDGDYTYTDPATKKLLLWKESQKQWTYAETGLPVVGHVAAQLSASPTNRPDHVVPSAETIVGSSANGVSPDPETGGYVYRDPATGTILYDWNVESGQWIPREPGTVPTPVPVPKAETVPIPQLGKKRKKKDKSTFLPDKDAATAVKIAPKPPEWFEMGEEKNRNVYVSNLPEDITLTEFTELMSKYGIVMEDPVKRELKIKLYQDDGGNNKGDGRCCYLKKESVDLALQILDGSNLRGKVIRAEHAKFTLKGSYNPKLKPAKPKGASKTKEGSKPKGQDKLLAWKPDPIAGQRMNREKTVVLKNMFDPEIFDVDAALILEYQKELRDECGNFGTVKKVKVYDRNPEGIATVTFGEYEEADACLEALNGRFYAGRKLDASQWDGKTRFVVEESEEEKEKRLQKWTEFLEKGE